MKSVIWGREIGESGSGLVSCGVVWSVTSDCSWEGVGELLHVFSFGLGLVVLSSEDDLHGALGTRRGTSHWKLLF